jgi:hypothetical protein
VTARPLVSVATAAGVRLEAVDGRRVIVSGGAGRMVPVWDARSGNHRRIEVDAKAHGIVTTEELIVVATSLGLAAFRFTTTAAAAVLHQR